MFNDKLPLALMRNNILAVISNFNDKCMNTINSFIRSIN